MAGEDDRRQTKGFRLLSIQEIQNTPCLRESLLQGAVGSVTVGLLYFLATSRVKRSFIVAYAGFTVTTFGSWFYCRLNNAKLRMQQRRIQEGIKNKILYEGTALDPTRKGKSEAPSDPS